MVRVGVGGVDRKMLRADLKADHVRRFFPPPLYVGLFFVAFVLLTVVISSWLRLHFRGGWECLAKVRRREGGKGGRGVEGRCRVHVTKKILTSRGNGSTVLRRFGLEVWHTLTQAHARPHTCTQTYTYSRLHRFTDL